MQPTAKTFKAYNLSCADSPHVDSAARAHAKFGTPLNPKTTSPTSPLRHTSEASASCLTPPYSASTVDPSAYFGNAAAQSDGSARFQLGLPRSSPFFSVQRTIYAARLCGSTHANHALPHQRFGALLRTYLTFTYYWRSRA